MALARITFETSIVGWAEVRSPTAVDDFPLLLGFASSPPTYKKVRIHFHANENVLKRDIK